MNCGKCGRPIVNERYYEEVDSYKTIIICKGCYERTYIVIGNKLEFQFVKPGHCFEALGFRWVKADNSQYGSAFNLINYEIRTFFGNDIVFSLGPLTCSL